jgi:hypothetical protein
MQVDKIMKKVITKIIYITSYLFLIGLIYSFFGGLGLTIIAAIVYFPLLFSSKQQLALHTSFCLK